MSTILNFHVSILGISIPLVWIVGALFFLNLLWFIIKKVKFFNFHLSSKAVTMDTSTELDPKRQAWIAKGSNLSSQNGLILNTLETGAPREVVYKYLYEDWGLTTKEEIFETVNQLLSGSKAEAEIFNLLTEIRSTNTPDQWEAVFAKKLRVDGTSEKDIEHLLGFMNLVKEIELRMHQDVLLGKDFVQSIDSYDLQRAINISRWAYQLSLLSDSEAWEIIEKAASLIKSKYQSYAESSVGYIMGRVIFSGEIDEFYETQLECHRKLLSDPSSPWLTLPW